MQPFSTSWQDRKKYAGQCTSDPESLLLVTHPIAVIESQNGSITVQKDLPENCFTYDFTMPSIVSLVIACTGICLEAFTSCSDSTSW